MAWECRFLFLNIWSDRDGERADEGEDRNSSETELEFVSVGASERPDDGSVLGKSECVDWGFIQGIFCFSFSFNFFYRFSLCKLVSTDLLLFLVAVTSSRRQCRGVSLNTLSGFR